MFPRGKFCLFYKKHFFMQFAKLLPYFITVCRASTSIARFQINTRPFTKAALSYKGEITQFLRVQPGKWFDGSLTWNVDRDCRHIECRWSITSIMWCLHECRGNSLLSFWIHIEYNTWSTYLPSEFYVLICTSQ